MSPALPYRDYSVSRFFSSSLSTKYRASQKPHGVLESVTRREGDSLSVSPRPHLGVQVSLLVVIRHVEVGEVACRWILDAVGGILADLDIRRRIRHRTEVEVRAAARLEWHRG